MDSTVNIKTQQQKVDYILKRGSEYFGLTEKDFEHGRKRGSRSKVWHKKRYLILPLHDLTVSSFNEIARLLGYYDHANVIYLYRTLKEELSNELYGSEKTKLVYDEFIKYLNL